MNEITGYLIKRSWTARSNQQRDSLAVTFFLFVWYSNKGICDNFCGAFATRPPFPCEPHQHTRPTLTTLLNLTLTTHSQQTQLYHYLVAVGLVDSTKEKFWQTLRSVDCLIDSWTDNLGDRDAFWMECIDRWKKCQLLHQLITWPIYQRRRRYAYWRTQNEGWWEWAVTISNQRHKYSLIDSLINKFIYQWTEKQTNGHISSTLDISMHYLTDLSTETQRPISMYTNLGVLGMGHVYFKSKNINIHLSIDQYINWSIYQWTE